MSTPERQYIAIDLKSFYASVECAERGLDPMSTNLVVADLSRTEKTICLAVSPSLKSYGIPGRARYFEVVERLKDVNARRLQQIASGRFASRSVSDIDLKKNPDWEVEHLVAPPRMALYLEYSSRIYETYLKYVAPEDIFSYSVDEVFMDVTNYLYSYKMTAHELARTMVRDVLETTGVTATAGIGTNMYLCKVAMDVMAKHIPADNDGVRIAELDERTYREKLWGHRPITDFWRVGRGTANRLAVNGIYTMGQLARCSIHNEALLYRLFGVNAELLIDHAWGWEPCTIADVKAYKPSAHSLSNGQVLQNPYNRDMALVVLREMADTLALSLVDKGLVANSVSLYVGFETRIPDGVAYDGEVVSDRFGRQVPRPVNGGVSLSHLTSASSIITSAVEALYDRLVPRGLLIRRLNVALGGVVPEDSVKQMPSQQLNLFEDNEDALREQENLKKTLEKEHRIQEAVLAIKKKFGKNALLKGSSFSEGATAKSRNQQIGGHQA